MKIGQKVVIEPSYKLPMFHGKVGILSGINTFYIDSDGFYEDGTQYRFARPVTTYDVKFVDQPWVTLCVHDSSDINFGLRHSVRSFLHSIVDYFSKEFSNLVLTDSCQKLIKNF